jgi:hypothetical protein
MTTTAQIKSTFAHSPFRHRDRRRLLAACSIGAMPVVMQHATDRFDGRSLESPAVMTRAVVSSHRGQSCCLRWHHRDGST